MRQSTLLLFYNFLYIFLQMKSIPRLFLFQTAVAALNSRNDHKYQVINALTKIISSESRSVVKSLFVVALFIGGVRLSLFARNSTKNSAKGLPIFCGTLELT